MLQFALCVHLNRTMRHHYYGIFSKWGDLNNIINIFFQNFVERRGLFDQASLFATLVCYDRTFIAILGLILLQIGGRSSVAQGG